MNIWKDLEYDDRRNCILNCIYNVSLLLESSFYPFYDDLWDFSLEPRKLDGSEYIMSEVEKIESNCLNKFKKKCGISCIRTKPSEEPLKDYLLSDRKSVIIARMDLFDCYWSQFYKKMHYPHYFFIQYISEGILHCSDPFYKKDLFELQGFELMDELLQFEKDESNSYDIEFGIYDHLIKLKEKSNEKSIFETVREFADWTGEIEDIKEISNDEDIDNVFIIQRLTNIKGTRYYYSQLLKQAGLEDEAISMQEISYAWSEVCMLFIKAVLNNKNTLCLRIKKQLINIADSEELLYNKLLKYFEDSRIKMILFDELLNLQTILQTSVTAEIRSIGAQYYKNIAASLSIDEILSLCEKLLQKKTWAHGVIAYDWAFRSKKKYKEDIFPVFENWLHNYIRRWGDCDDFCTHALGELLRQYPNLFINIIPWTKSKDFWVRRAAPVILLYPLRHGVFSKREVSRICNALMKEKHPLVQKGSGWLLKEYSKISPGFVCTYLKKNVSKMSRTTFRYALQKLGPKEQLELMALK